MGVSPIVDQLSHALRDVVQDQAVAAQLDKIETYLLPVDQATPEALRHKLASQIALHDDELLGLRRWTAALLRAVIVEGL